MYAGRAVEVADVKDLYADRRMPYTAGLLGSVPRLGAPRGERLVPIPGAPPSLVALPPGCPFAPRCPLAIDDCLAAEPVLLAAGGGPGHAAACIRTDQVAGRSASDIYGVALEPPDTDEDSDPPVVVRVRDLSRTYRLTKGVVFRRQIGEVRAVDNVSFEVRQGRTLGIVGESGSGKSTTLHEILELRAPQSGSIEVLGDDVATLTPQRRRALRGDLQVVFQDPVASLDPRLPVFDLLAEPLQANGFDKTATDVRVAAIRVRSPAVRSSASASPVR
jgi:peptide/nickel transport system ATP-binding protein